MPMAVQAPDLPTPTKKDTGLKVITPQTEHGNFVSGVAAQAQEAHPSLTETKSPVTSETPLPAHPAMEAVGAERVGAAQPDLPKFSINEEFKVGHRDWRRNIGGFFKKYLTGGHTEKFEGVGGWAGDKLHRIKQWTIFKKKGGDFKREETE